MTVLAKTTAFLTRLPDILPSLAFIIDCVSVSVCAISTRFTNSCDAAHATQLIHSLSLHLVLCVCLIPSCLCVPSRLISQGSSKDGCAACYGARCKIGQCALERLKNLKTCNFSNTNHELSIPYAICPISMLYALCSFQPGNRTSLNVPWSMFSVRRVLFTCSYRSQHKPTINTNLQHEQKTDRQPNMENRPPTIKKAKVGRQSM